MRICKAKNFCPAQNKKAQIHTICVEHGNIGPLIFSPDYSRI